MVPAHRSNPNPFNGLNCWMWCTVPAFLMSYSVTVFFLFSLLSFTCALFSLCRWNGLVYIPCPLIRSGAGWRGGRSMHFIMGRSFDNWIEGCHIIYGSCPLYYWQDSQFCIRPETEVMQSGLRQWVEGWLTAAKFSDNSTLDKSC